MREKEPFHWESEEKITEKANLQKGVIQGERIKGSFWKGVALGLLGFIYMEILFLA